MNLQPPEIDGVAGYDLGRGRNPGLFAAARSQYIAELKALEQCKRLSYSDVGSPDVGAVDTWSAHLHGYSAQEGQIPSAAIAATMVPSTRPLATPLGSKQRLRSDQGALGGTCSWRGNGSVGG